MDAERPGERSDRAVVRDLQIASALVPSPVTVRVVLPPGETDDPLPLLLLLHGGEGDLSVIDEMRFVFERMWADAADRRLPPLAVATPRCGRSFYLDRRDGSERWETFLFTELLAHLRRVLPVRGDRRGTLIAGVSMGGLGSLRLAFKHPEAFAAVAALEPGIDPALSFGELQPRHTFYRPRELMEALFGRPVDPQYWGENNPASIAAASAERIAASGLQIYLECGDQDALHLDEGAEFLHRVLFDRGVPHEYRLVRGADHVGGTLADRAHDALGFLARALAPLRRGRTVGLTPTLFRRVLAGERTAAGIAERQALGPVLTTFVDAPGARLEVRVRGRGRDVVLLPSLGRGVEDFDDLAAELVDAGYRVILPQPRGIGESRLLAPPATLHDLARDAACAIEATCIRPATVLGHALGNRVARTIATDRPDLVRDVILVAAGGKVPPPPEVAASLAACFDLAQPPEEHLRHVARAFFADPKSAHCWQGGWFPEAARAQGAAVRATSVDEWWLAGGKEVLILQPACDAVASAENARLLADALGERARVVEIAHAGHAALPEQPAAIAAAVIDFLDR